MNQPKSINQLMRHLRDNCNIDINASYQKRQLINYGYYHGYKGYRFVRRAIDRIPYTDFSQIVAVIEFDSALKALLYPELMYLESAMKSIVCNATITNCSDASFEHISREKMNDQTTDTHITQKRLMLRNNVYGSIARQYKAESRSPNKMIRHFYNRGEDVPIWALFEILKLGDFANFVQCLNRDIREKILIEIDIRNVALDTDCTLLSSLLYTLKPLRNAVAHNNVIFDARMYSEKGKMSKKWLESETGVHNISFYSIVDFIILISCLLKKIDRSPDRAQHLVECYVSYVSKLKADVPLEVFDMIIQHQHDTKINGILNYLK